MIEHSFTGAYYSVRRFVRQLAPPSELPFRRLECGPGEEAQVDFGTGARIVDRDGKRRKTHLFRIVLSHSRKGYSEVVYRQTTDDFLRCVENAFRQFGGAPRRLILDNLRAAVQKADWYDPELNPKVRSFGEHYRFVFLPTRPYMPRHKGKVENGVGYVQDNAIKGRMFSSLEEQNGFLREWELTVADTRIHGTTRLQVGKHFADAEREALLPLPPEPFPSYREARRIVHRDGHVEVERRLLRRAAGVPGAGGVGPLGRPHGAGLQRANAANCRAHQARTWPLQHAASVHRRREDHRCRARHSLALGQSHESTGPAQHRLGPGHDRGPRHRRRSSTPGPLEPCGPPPRFCH